MMLIRGFLAAVLAFLVMVSTAMAVTLVSPSGQPVGGQLQRWADQSLMPTVAGSVVVMPVSTFCGHGPTGGPSPGCSAGPPFYTAGNGTAGLALAVTGRWSLYFELGHLFDWKYLTWRDRAWLARQWRAFGVPWLDSTAALYAGNEDGLEGAFADVYGNCAYSGYSVARFQFFRGDPIIHPRGLASTCDFIRKVWGQRAGRYPIASQ